MTFTIGDAENDGKLKKEVGPIMVSVAQQTSPRLFGKFIQACEENGQEPSIVLGDLVVRALNNDEFSQRILNMDVTMDKLQANSIREEDIEFVKDMADKFGLEPDEQKHPVERIIERRIEAMSSPGIVENGVGEIVQNGNERQVRKLQQRVQRLEAELQKERSEDVEQAEAEPVEDGRKDIDELFEGLDDGAETAPLEESDIEPEEKVVEEEESEELVVENEDGEPIEGDGDGEE